MKKTLPEVLTDDEVKRLLSVPNKRYRTGLRNYLMMRVAVQTGMRVSELINLKRGDIDFMTGKTFIRQAKGKKDRITFIKIETRDEIIKLWEKMNVSSLYCFSTLSGSILDTGYLRKTIKKYGSKLGLTKRVYFHLLRHTALTKLYQDTHDIRLVQDIAGHRDISTTMIYTHISGENIKDTLLTLGFNL